MDKNVENLCKICNTDLIKYVCPRCNIPYCSVNCYKAASHSDCSEAFYKECIQDFIRNQEDDSESRNKMVEILQRVRENDNNSSFSSDDSDDVESIKDRFEGINLDDADSVWENLTKEERQEFINLIKEGDVTQLLTVWDPWWNKRYSIPKVRFADEDIPNFEADCPPIPKCILPLSHISRSKPSETIFFNLVNVLGSYVIMCRYCNGEHGTMVNEAVTILLSLSKNLSQNENYNSANIAFESIKHETVNCEFVTTTDVMKQTMKDDVIKILQGPNEDKYVHYVEAALSDIHSVLRKSRKNESVKLNKGNFSTLFPEVNKNTKFSKDVIYKCLKKIAYYQSWCLDYYNPNVFFIS